MCLALGAASCAAAQDGGPWSERRNLGFKGPVRSVLTTAERPNPDPRPPAQRALFVPGGPEWFAFDSNGKRIEIALGSSGDQIVNISKRTSVKPDGTEVWTNSDGHTTESRKQEILLPDGSREVTYYANAEVTNRDLSRFDEKGRVVGFRSYDGKGNLTSEQSTVFSDAGEVNTWKLYDHEGRIAVQARTESRDDPSRIDRWQYDGEGRLGWHVAVNGSGELLTHWYKPGYQPKLSSSDSLGICRPGECVSYKFDEEGRLQKTVKHSGGKAYAEPDSEEHYNAAGDMDEKVEIQYTRDVHGNWTSRSVFIWDAVSNQMTEVERDSRKIEYY
jgi:hypothetical protein